MSVIYLKHELHGNKVACSEEEAKLDEKGGWKRYEISAILKPHIDSKPPVEDGELTKLRAVYEEKFGKRPHHKKTVETLKAELGA